ncbi:MAG: 16S rRNA (uracil(1498)-N(3))-methyltransferase [Thermosynechococcaceae cyanobacterium]
MTQLQRLAIAPEQCFEQTVLLTPEQQHYLIHVLRLKGGDRFIAILPQGQWQLAELQPSPNAAQLLEPIVIQTELAQPITLMAALPKGQGFEEVVRTVTEMGVTTLIPLLTERTVAYPSDRKLERWRRIATEAAEQAHRQIVPDLWHPVSFDQALRMAQDDRFATQGHFICVTDDTVPHLLHPLINEPSMGILMMVGPEGGWTPTEQAAAIAQGFRPVSLGRRVLRAITASIAVVALLAAHIDAAQTAE